MELRSLALGESEALGIERIPRARRMRMTKVHMMSMVNIIVDDDDGDGGFRPGSREYLGFAIFWFKLLELRIEANRNTRDRFLRSERR